MNNQNMLKTSSFYFNLPTELIAQTPLDQRDDSRLMFLNKKTGAIEHRHFHELPELLQPNDCLVLNDSRVLPARIIGEKEGAGAKVEFLLLEQKGINEWEALAGPGKRAKKGSRFRFSDGLLFCEVIDIMENGNRLIRFFYDGNFHEILERVGQMPLPPYIHKKLSDQGRYQTVYAKHNGSSAAPTAGLHFTSELLAQIQAKGISVAYVTLHVGLGTFRPVNAECIIDHKMHAERYQMDETAAAIIQRAKQAGGRIIAVGTTSCRTLESIMQTEKKFCKSKGTTDIFIYPGYIFQAVDGLITNFHLPESTLIMLVSALAGKEAVMNAYSKAIQEQYRFFSFGDAMLIL